MNTPKDKTELRRFFGMCNYVSKFIPGYSEKTAIIREHFFLMILSGFGINNTIVHLMNSKSAYRLHPC